MVTVSRTTTDVLNNLATAAEAVAAAARAVAQMQESSTDDIYPLSEAAAKLGGISTDWLRTQCRENRMPHYHYAGQYFISSAQIAWFLDQRRKGDW